ncbi:PhoU-like domain fused to TrkA-C domain [Halalkaliarchaeum sp. AArc-CO]|uniref:potassium channel family protein n=1 Tax=Halalkaliarchaeum sp. AArc-CO TaxID=2866381 RepID=UPI00217CC340|nr:TrkA C-terminal domain-containing protein [Halalkaliarchaeum sp. AArc-CO]UWG49783.1 PhoU-like domain fused to TrkA-C domain [Halalkaliarchaeum sp. AArc-CO]
MEEIAYRSRNVRETLVELKNISELSVDLGYAAALYDYPLLAEEVLELEARADSLQYPAKIALMLAAKRSSDAEQLVGIVQVVEAAVGITNAAADIAAIVTNDIGLPTEVRGSLPTADEVLLKATVGADSEAAGRTLGDLSFETEAGVSAIAIRRGNGWNIDPNEEAILEVGDVVIGRGPEAGVRTVREMLTGDPDATGDRHSDDVDELGRAADMLVDLKDISELAVGLAYAAVLFDDDQLAAEVRDLERQSDALKNEVETLVIEAGDRVSEPASLRGLLHLATASEAICDAAIRIADIVLRDGSVHPVFGQAIGDSDELITTTAVEPGSTLAGETLGGVELEEATGVAIMAIHRGNNWILAPTGETQLFADDVLIARGPEDGANTVREWARE